MDPIMDISNCVIAVGAWLILWQISLTKRLAATEFEDNLDTECRNIIHRMPPEALLGEDLGAQQMARHMDDFLRYIDLSNKQAFLRQRRRVSGTSWSYWSEGMRSNFSRPAFKLAWQIVKEKCPGDFPELRRLESSDFRGDPAKWTAARPISRETTHGTTHSTRRAARFVGAGSCLR